MELDLPSPAAPPPDPARALDELRTDLEIARAKERLGAEVQARLREVTVIKEAQAQLAAEVYETGIKQARGGAALRLRLPPPLVAPVFCPPTHTFLRPPTLQIRISNGIAVSKLEFELCARNVGRAQEPRLGISRCEVAPSVGREGGKGA